MTAPALASDVVPSAARPQELAALVPAGRLLEPAECEATARAIAEAPALWSDVVLTPTESGTRSYALLHETEDVEVWLLAWRPGHTTGYHDHGTSNVGFCVVSGSIAERQLRFAEPSTEAFLAAGDARSAPSDYIHCLEWHAGDPALSVHVYSPPLAQVGQYRVGEAGVLRREVQAGRDELTLD